MKNLVSISYRRLLGLLLLSAAFVPLPVLAAVIGPSLQDKLAAIGPLDPVEVIVSYDQSYPLTTDQLLALDALGLSGYHFQELPMAGLIVLAADVDQIAALPGVQSVWLNEPLSYDNDNSRAITGVDRMRTDSNLRNSVGLPYSGLGVTVLVNDSGIDAQHPDLPFGNKVVQNVAAQTNLNSSSPLLPITYLEGLPDTDILGGHGTHVAGTVGGTGAASGGQFAGVAPGANIIGYGSGAGLFILDTLGGFDYALVNQFQYNIRVISNSFGSPGDTGTPFNPDHPTNIATRRLAERNIIVVFSAGNSGPGEDTITGNFKKAPWVVTVGAGDSNGNLADFSSRGVRNGGGQVVIGGQALDWVDRPNVVAPGVNVISARAKSDPLSILSLPDGDPAWIHYHALSGTSMAAPHVSGIVALMLEANPMLGWREVIDILELTATNMPGREDWEVGAGHVNAHAAVIMAAGQRDDFGQTLALERNFNAMVEESRLDGPVVDLFFSPLGMNETVSFEVAEGLSTVTARANVSDNTVALVLTDPDGNRFGSGISLPLLGPSIAVSAPAVPGTWTIQARGIGAISGVALDPLGLTNGTGLPGSIAAHISFMQVDGFSGLDDISGHPAQGIIERAVAERLLDAYPDGTFQPDQLITRAEIADYLSLGAGLRQILPSDGSHSLLDVAPDLLSAAEAAHAIGGALRDGHQVQDALVPAVGPGQFDPEGLFQRAELAYTLVQALGLQNQAQQIRQALQGEAITVAYQGQRIELHDDGNVPEALRGHVQLALDLNLMNARFTLHQGPFDLVPTIRAHFDPQTEISRADYAFGAVNLLDRLRQ